MTYIENIFICLTAPMIVGAICVGHKYCRAFIFVICGYVVCLLSAYINTFFAQLYSADAVIAAVEITPVIEEILKILPLIFYMLVFEPKKEEVLLALFTIVVSFATFENVCYITENGASNVVYLLIRGFATGSMHVVCGTIVGYGLIYFSKFHFLKFAGIIGMLSASITYHAIYNLLVSTSGAIQVFGYIFPIATVIIAVTARKIYKVS
ncbi:MAG: PrsW family glutamic-type intramembrane protease [Oscillospiraceae bacterium]